MAANLNSSTDKLESDPTQDQLVDTRGKERTGERKTGPESESQGGRRGAEGGALLSFGTNPVQAHVGPIRGTRSSLLHRHSGQNQTYLLHPSSRSLLSLQQENMGRQKVYLDKLSRFFQIRNLLLRQALAECLGTLILVMFGCGAVAQQVLSSGSHGMFLTVNFAFGFAAMLGILVCGQVSGGHLNPAVTFALCLLGRDRWRKFPMFFLFQTIGAFFGAAIIFGMYYDALWDHPGAFNVTGPNATAGIFATYPGKHLTIVNGFFDQIIGTAALIVCILAIVDPFNNPIPQGLEAFTVGFVVLVIGLSMGFNSGYAVNPARDIGPRLFTAIAGWGSDVFTVRKGWFLVPLCAPFLGTIIGTMIYQLMVGFHVEGEVRDKNNAQQENVRLTNVTSNDNSKETTKETH